MFEFDGIPLQHNHLIPNELKQNIQKKKQNPKNIYITSFCFFCNDIIEKESKTKSILRIGTMSNISIGE
jgi:hypothetical protein